MSTRHLSTISYPSSARKREHMVINDVTVYADALFMAAFEANAAEAIYEDINAVAEAIRRNPEYISLIDTPALDRKEKYGLEQCAFESIHPLLLNLIKLLGDKSMFYCFEKIARAYNKLYDEHSNILRGEAISAHPLTPEQLSALTQKLCDKYGKRVILTNTVEPDILGGIRLDIAGIQLDGSLRRRLCDIEKILKNTVI